MSPFDQSHIGADLWLDEHSDRRRQRWHIEVLQGLAIAWDVVLVTILAVASRLVYGQAIGDGTDLSAAIDTTLSFGVLAAVLFVGFMVARRAYSAAHLSAPRRQAVLVTQAWVFTFFALAWVAFLLKVTSAFSRGGVTIDFFVGGGLVLASHVIAARLLARRFALGRMSLTRVAVVAVCDQRGLERIRRRLRLKGIEIVTLSAIAPTPVGRAGFADACRKAVEEVRHALATTRIDGIYLFLSWRERRRIDEIKAAMLPMPVPIVLFADRQTERLFSRPSLRIGDLLGFELQRAPLSRVDRMAKRTLDVVVATTALVVLAPLLLLTSAAILIESGRPVLFRQNRKGFGARPFAILKFRSMTVQENGATVTQASKGDRRVTRLGRILRRTSIDELPQLINVLRGDMSICGPRPHAVAHDDLYDRLIATYAFRQHVKPGITGWAQVNGCRGETRDVEQMRARVEHDIWYINNWSLWLDIKIIVLTALKIFFDEQAY